MKIGFSLRDHRPFLSEAFGIRWRYPIWERDNALGADLKGSAGRPKSKGNVADIVSLIERDDVDVKEIRKAASDVFGIPRTRCQELLKEACDSGAIVNARKGRSSYYKLNPSNASENNIETHQTAKQLEIA